MAEWDEEVRTIAEWVLDLVRPAYGPRGAYTLLAGEDLELHAGASTLRDLPSISSGLAPYQKLATDVHGLAGDQANLAIQLAAGMVRHAHRAMDQGVPRAAILEGLALAGRQSRAWLTAHARPATPVAVLAACDPFGWRHELIAGLLRLADSRLDLDQVAIERRDGPTWLDHLHMDLHGSEGARPDARVLLIREGPRVKPHAEAVQRFLGPQAEDELLRRWFENLNRLGVDLLLVGKGLGPIRDRISNQCLVADNVPEDAMRRLESATGAQQVARLEDGDTQVMGWADVRKAPRRQGGWILKGPGPGATFNVGVGNPHDGAMRMDAAERLLRTAGCVLQDARGLPGGGRWQQELATALEAMADHAPGKAAFGVRVCARALQDTVACLLANEGRDPLDGGFVGDVHDPAAAVDVAVAAAHEAVILLLRVDGRHAKKASRGVDLRGGTGKAGSPKGMPGDIPEHM